MISVITVSQRTLQGSITSRELGNTTLFTAFTCVAVYNCMKTQRWPVGWYSLMRCVQR